MSAFQLIKDEEASILQKLKDWGVLDQIAYLTYPKEWYKEDEREIILRYQREFCERLKSPDSTKYTYLSMTSYTGYEIDGVPPGGILLAMRTVGKTTMSTLVYLLPRKAGGVRIYLIRKNDEDLELSLSNPVYTFDNYLGMLNVVGIVSIKNIEDVISMQLTDIHVFDEYMKGIISLF